MGQILVVASYLMSATEAQLSAQKNCLLEEQWQKDIIMLAFVLVGKQ